MDGFSTLLVAGHHRAQLLSWGPCCPPLLHILPLAEGALCLDGAALPNGGAPPRQLELAHRGGAGLAPPVLARARQHRSDCVHLCRNNLEVPDEHTSWRYIPLWVQPNPPRPEPNNSKNGPNSFKPLSTS